MKTIEQAAIDYACDIKLKRNGVSCEHRYIVDDFKAGVEFSQKWIRVKDEMPEDNQIVLCRSFDEDDDYAYTAASYNSNIGSWVIACNMIDVDFSYNPDHWRPITKK